MLLLPKVNARRSIRFDKKMTGPKIMAVRETAQWLIKLVGKCFDFMQFYSKAAIKCFTLQLLSLVLIQVFGYLLKLGERDYSCFGIFAAEE